MPTSGATERLGIEPLTIEHALEWHTALGDERVGTYIGGPDVTTVDDLERRIGQMLLGPGGSTRSERWWNWIVRLAPGRPGGGTVIGRLQATTYGDWAEIAYLFGPQWWGHGYATEGSQWLLDHLRSALDISEVWAAIHPDNLASVRVVERLGFERAAAPGRDLGSYDDGDLVFVHRG